MSDGLPRVAHGYEVTVTVRRPDPRHTASWCREGVAHDHRACGPLWNSTDPRDVEEAARWVGDQIRERPDRTDGLHGLAVDAIRELRAPYGPLGDGSLRSGSASEIADAVLAAVLPAHRSQVLAEAVGSLQPDIDWQRRMYGDGADRLAIGRLVGMEDAQQAIRRLAESTPPAARTASQGVQDAPEVAQGTPEPLRPPEPPATSDEPTGTGADTWHVGRSWTGHRLEDGCPCSKGACGLAAEPFDPTCLQHPQARAKTIRQGHRAADCPGAAARRAFADLAAQFGAKEETP